VEAAGLVFARGLSFAPPVATAPSVAVAAAAFAVPTGSVFGPAFATAPRPDGLGLDFARGFAWRAVADLGAAGAPGFGAPTASGAGEASGLAGTVASSSSRRTRPARSTAFPANPVAVSISFFGSDGIRAYILPAATRT
jgi:hypothetical protein